MLQSEEIKSTIPVNVRYWDTVNNTQVGKSFTITVDADATSVNTSTFKGYSHGIVAMSWFGLVTCPSWTAGSGLRFAP